MKVFKWMYKIVKDYYIYRNYLSPKEDRIKSRKFGSIMYALLGWQFLGYTLYVIMKDNIPTDKHELMRKLDLEDTKSFKVIQLQGLNVVDEFDETLEDDTEEYVEVI